MRNAKNCGRIHGRDVQRLLFVIHIYIGVSPAPQLFSKQQDPSTWRCFFVQLHLTASASPDGKCFTRRTRRSVPLQASGGRSSFSSPVKRSEIELLGDSMVFDYFGNRGQPTSAAAATAAEETGRGTSTAVAGAGADAGGAQPSAGGWAAPPQTHPCTRCDVWNVPASLALLLLLFLVSTVLTMYKVLRSYSKKAERKQEVSRASDRNGHISAGNYYDESLHHKGQNGHASNGQLLAVDNRHLSNAYAAGQAFSESSSYETREHFERKVQRVKKTRGERERSRSIRRGDEVLMTTVFIPHLVAHSLNFIVSYFRVSSFDNVLKMVVVVALESWFGSVRFHRRFVLICQPIRRPLGITLSLISRRRAQTP